ncbi:MAG: TonB family protein [Spirochaetaceae bacterium]|jgi:protein TonB|nr:TonB family protein [Spirochaetaceae bacterium]
MKQRNSKFFFAMIFTAALIHAGVLIMVPDSSRRAEQKPAAQKKPPVQILFSVPQRTEEIPPVPPPAALKPAEEPRSPAPPPDPAAESPAVPEPAAKITGAAEPDFAGAEPAAFLANAADTPGGIPAGIPEIIPVMPDPKPRADSLLRYERMIRSLIDGEKEYPYQARRQDQEGKVEIRFVLSRQGRLVGEPALEKRSRYRLLNASALEAVKNAAPYPPFPEEINEDEMSFQVAISFSLR